MIELYCDMILTGTKPLAFIPEISSEIVRVAHAKDLLVITSKRGTWLYKYETLSDLIIWLDENMDTSGTKGEDVTAHWVAGLAFGYSAAEIDRWIRGVPYAAN